MRGMAAVRPGADEFARELGITPLTSIYGPFSLGDETVFHQTYRYWRDKIASGMRAKRCQRELEGV